MQHKIDVRESSTPGYWVARCSCGCQALSDWMGAKDWALAHVKACADDKDK